MDQDCIKLTSYFSDRHKPGDHAHVASGDGDVVASIVLRGADGPGLVQQVRTGDAAISGPGLITLERGRLLSGEIDPIGLRDEATRLTVFFSRTDRVYQVPAFEVICELLYRRGAAGAIAFAGQAGDGHRAPVPGRADNTPMMVVAITSGDRLGPLLPELGGLLRRPLFILEPVFICKRDGKLFAPPPSESLHKLSVYASAAAKHNGQPLHRAIVRRLHDDGFGDATTVRGIWGFRGDRVPHGGGHHAPAVTIVTAAPPRVLAAFAIIDELTAEHGLVTSNAVTLPAG